jgi:hypothetical protein
MDEELDDIRTIEVHSNQGRVAYSFRDVSLKERGDCY